MVSPTLLFIIATIVFISILTFAISKRLNDKGCLSIFFTFIVISTVVSIFLSTSYLSFKGIYQYAQGETYKAKLKNYKSYVESYQDSDDRWRKKKLYIRFFEFADKHNVKLTLQSVTRTGELPVIGEIVKISYIEGEETVLEHSYITYFLLLIGCFFAIIFGFLTQGLIAYSLGKDMKNFRIFFTNSLLRSVPVSLALFAIGLSVVIFNFFRGKDVVAIHEAVLAFICLLVIVFVLIKIYFVPKKNSYD